jgi:UDP-N-acetyl-D-glucosamine dehydrogenase
MKIAVIGQGYVGFPLAQVSANTGFKVIGYDINPEVISRLKNTSSNLELTSDSELLKGCDIYVIAVPTPLNELNKPDLSYVISASEVISKYVIEGALVINESTSFPGTLRDVILPIVEKSVKGVLFAAAPERIDPENKTWNLSNTTRVVGGLTDEATTKAAFFYSSFCKEVFVVSSPEVAESSKLLENTYRQINIAFINQFAHIMDKLNIPVTEVIEAAATKPFGFMKFSPGIGVGGHCIPIDPIYLAEKAELVGAPTSIIRLANEINITAYKYTFNKISEILDNNFTNKKICLVGLSYKPNTKDLRESPSILLWDLLIDSGADLSYHDNFHPTFRGQKSVAINDNLFDLSILAVKHNDLDFKSLSKCSKKIFSCSDNALI